MDVPEVKVHWKDGTQEQRTSTEKKTSSWTERTRLLLGAWIETAPAVGGEEGRGRGSESEEEGER